MLGGLVALLAVLRPSAGAVDESFRAVIDAAEDFAQAQISATLEKSPQIAYPYATAKAEVGGAWQTRAVWNRGFFPGMLWHFAEFSEETDWPDTARSWSQPLEVVKNDTLDHDIGFILLSSIGRAERWQGGPSDRAILLTAAQSFDQHWMPAVGAYWSFNFNGNVKNEGRTGGFKQRQNIIIDTTMNLGLPFWSARNGGPGEHYDHALSHLRTVIRDLVRADGSTIQVVDYYLQDTVDAVSGERHPAGSMRGTYGWQGYSNQTTWSRGQAWALCGLAAGYRETGDAEVLAATRRVADYWLEQVPEDGVPYWDFEAGNAAAVPPEYYATVSAPWDMRDTSAAAVAACGLLELYFLLDDPEMTEPYLTGADRILLSLAQPPYLAQGTNLASILAQGCNSFPGGEIGLSWGDYYFLEAIRRRRSLEPLSGIFQAGPALGDVANWTFGQARRWQIEHDRGEARLRLAQPHFQADPESPGPGEMALWKGAVPTAGRLDFLARYDVAVAGHPRANCAAVWDILDQDNYTYAVLGAHPSVSRVVQVRAGQTHRVEWMQRVAWTDQEYHQVSVSWIGGNSQIWIDGERWWSGRREVPVTSVQCGLGADGHAVFFDDISLRESATPGLENWLNDLGLTLAGAGGEWGDPDGDQLSTLLEFALGWHPGQAEELQPVWQTEGSLITLTLPRNGFSEEVRLVVEWSNDLQGWSPLAGVFRAHDILGQPIWRITLPGPLGPTYLRFGAEYDPAVFFSL